MTTGSYSDTFGGGGWNSYSSYLQQKDSRIQEQLKRRYGVQRKDTHETLENKRGIFSDCVFWLDGYTRIPEYKLKALMVQHGGSYESYDLSKVTHIVADNLAMGNKKWQRIRDKGSQKFHVVTSEFILACIERQTKIKESYFVPTALQSRKDGFGTIFRYVVPSPIKDSINKIEQEQQETMSSTKKHSTPNRKDKDVEAELEFPHIVQSNSHEVEHPSFENLLNTDSNHILQQSTLRKSTPCLGTDDEMNFVECFFKNSRLHFIGRWRERLLRRLKLLPFAPLRPNVISSDGVLHSGPKTVTMFRFLQPTNEMGGANIDTTPCSEILHIDFDAFFVSVALRKHPELIEKPVAVSHRTVVSASSGSEIASCNYVARQFGITKGMWIGHAKKLCPELKVLPYDFESIENISLELMEILTDITSRVLPVSCDEAYLQLVGDIEISHATDIAYWIQNTVMGRTGCRVSIGIGPNLLLAKLAGQLAKPSNSQFGSIGIYRIEKISSIEFMEKIQIKELPGFGERAVQKLDDEKYYTCGDVLRNSTLERIQILIGKKLGENLWSFCHGCDPRSIPYPQFGIGDERTLTVSVNWGVRLTHEYGVVNFLTQMAQECERRLKDANGSTGDLTLKILKRAPHAPIEPSKYGGCGECLEFSSHERLNCQISIEQEILPYLVKMWKSGLSNQCPIPDLRGVTVMMARLKEIEDKPTSSGLLPITKHNESFKLDQSHSSRSSSMTNSLLTMPHADLHSVDTNIEDELISWQEEEPVKQLYPVFKESLLCNTMFKKDSRQEVSSNDEFESDDSTPPILSICKPTTYVCIPPTEEEIKDLVPIVSEDPNIPTLEEQTPKSTVEPYLSDYLGSEIQLDTSDNVETQTYVRKRFRLQSSGLIQEYSYPFKMRDTNSLKTSAETSSSGIRPKKKAKMRKTSVTKSKKQDLVSRGLFNFFDKAKGSSSDVICISDDEDGSAENSVSIPVEKNEQLLSTLTEKRSTSSCIYSPLWIVDLGEGEEMRSKLSNLVFQANAKPDEKLLFVGIRFSDSCGSYRSKADQELSYQVEEAEDCCDSICSDLSDVMLSVCLVTSLHIAPQQEAIDCGVDVFDCASKESGLKYSCWVHATEKLSSTAQNEIRTISDRVECRIRDVHLLTTYKHESCLKADSKRLEALNKLSIPLGVSSTVQDWMLLIQTNCWICTASTIVELLCSTTELERNFCIRDFSIALMLISLFIENRQQKYREPSPAKVNESCLFMLSFISEEIIGISTCIIYRKDLDIVSSFLGRLEFFWANTILFSQHLRRVAITCGQSRENDCWDVVVKRLRFSDRGIRLLIFAVHEFLVDYKQSIGLKHLV